MGCCRRHLLDGMMRVSNVLTPSTGNSTLSFPLVACDGESADLGSITLAKLLVRLPPARFRPQEYSNFEAQLAHRDLTTVKLVQQSFRRGLPLGEEATSRLGRDDCHGTEDRCFQTEVVSAIIAVR